MNPWSIRTALLARHAQHVVLIHFPIALFLTGVMFDLAASVMPPTEDSPSSPLQEALRSTTLVPLPAKPQRAFLARLRGLGLQLRRSELASVSFWNLTLAALSAIPAALTGLLAWQLELDGRRLKGTLLLHLLFGAASLLLIAGVWFVHQRARRSRHGPPPLRWPLEIAAALVVAFTGHLGGFLSGVNHL